MQYFIIIVIAVVILIVLGVSVQAILNASAWGILMLCAAVSFLMMIFFAVFLAKLLSGKKTKGKFLRADYKDNGAFKKYKSAVYEIEGKEYFNIFPYDLGIFYKTDKETELYIDKKGAVYDTMTRITILSGIMLSTAMTILMIMLTVYFYQSR